MQSRSELRAALLALAVGLGACTPRTNVPAGFLPAPKNAGTGVHGSWVELTIATGGGDIGFAGELLAVTADSVWVTMRPDSLRFPNSGLVVARRAIAQGKLGWFHADAASMGLVTLLGTLSTISNGAFLLLTAPMWIIGGSISTSVYAREPWIPLVPDTGRDLRAFARFPLGMPAGLDASFTRIAGPERARSPTSTPPEARVP